MTTQVVSKATELFMEMLKIAIEREREKRFSEKNEVLSGGEVTYQKLKEGGEVTMLPSFAKEDYSELIKQAKKMDIPVAAIRENGKDNTLSVFFNVQYLSNTLTYGFDNEKRQLYESCREDIMKIRERLDQIAAKERPIKRKAI